VEFVAAIVCENRFYNGEFIVSYFARDYPIPKADLSKVHNPYLFDLLNYELPRDFSKLSKGHQKCIKTLFLCRQIQSTIISLLPRELMYMIC
jgi:hypothetical protein